jgi:hypothetical protein
MDEKITTLMTTKELREMIERALKDNIKEKILKSRKELANRLGIFYVNI